MHTQGSWVFAISPACLWRRRIAGIWGTLRAAFIPPGLERSCMTNKNAMLVLSRNELDVMTMPTGESSMEMYTGGRNYPTRDEIALCAYHIYETRGRQNGHDIEDWLPAEQELRHHYG